MDLSSLKSGAYRLLLKVIDPENKAYDTKILDFEVRTEAEPLTRDSGTNLEHQ